MPSNVNASTSSVASCFSFCDAGERFMIVPDFHSNGALQLYHLCAANDCDENIMKNTPKNVIISEQLLCLKAFLGDDMT